MGKAIGKIKSVNQFLGDYINGFKDQPTTGAIGQALPWTAELGKGLGQAVPAAAVMIKFYEDNAHGRTPLEAGVYPCSGAMIQFFAETVTAQGPPCESADLAGAKAVATALKKRPYPNPNRWKVSPGRIAAIMPSSSMH